MVTRRLYPQRRRRRRRETKRRSKFGGENVSQKISANVRRTSSRSVKMVAGHENHQSASSITAQFGDITSFTIFAHPEGILEIQFLALITRINNYNYDLCPKLDN